MFVMEVIQRWEVIRCLSGTVGQFEECGAHTCGFAAKTSLPDHVWYGGLRRGLGLMMHTDETKI